MLVTCTFSPAHPVLVQFLIVPCLFSILAQKAPLKKIFDCAFMIEFLLLLCTFVPEVWRYSLQLMFCHVAPSPCRVFVHVCTYLNTAVNVLCSK